MAGYLDRRSSNRSTVEADQDAARSEQVNDAINKILDALRGNGCKQTLRIKDVEIDGGPAPE